jgi:hypothetical protein
VKLERAVAAWGSGDFERTLKHELEGLTVHDLPLQAALRGASRVAEQGFSVMVLGSSADGRRVSARIGVFFTGMEAGSCCADDPSPPCEQAEYGELRVEIDKATAEAFVSLEAETGSRD